MKYRHGFFTVALCGSIVGIPLGGAPVGKTALVGSTLFPVTPNSAL